MNFEYRKPGRFSIPKNPPRTLEQSASTRYPCFSITFLIFTCNWNLSQFSPNPMTDITGISISFLFGETTSSDNSLSCNIHTLSLSI